MLKNLCILACLAACSISIYGMDAGNDEIQQQLAQIKADRDLCRQRLVEADAERDNLFRSGRPVLTSKLEALALKVSIAHSMMNALKRKYNERYRRSFSGKPGSQPPICPELLYTEGEKEEYDDRLEKKNLTDWQFENFLYAMRNNDLSRWIREEQEMIVRETVNTYNADANTNRNRNTNTNGDLLPC